MPEQIQQDLVHMVSLNLTLEEYKLLGNLVLIGQGFVSKNTAFITVGMLGYKLQSHKYEVSESLADKLIKIENALLKEQENNSKG